MIFGLKNREAASSVKQYVHKLWLYTKKPLETIRLLTQIRAVRYDVVVDCMDNPSTTSRLIVRFAHARYSIGLENSPSGFYTHSIVLPNKATTHIVERTAMLLHAFGIYPQSSDLDLEYPIQPMVKDIASFALRAKKKIRLGINIAAGWEKYWGRENFINFLNKVRNLEIEVIGFATKEFQDELAAISNATALHAASIASCFDEFAAMLSDSDIILTPDTSAAHLAAAWKIPCIVMYAGVTDTLMSWTPFNSPHRAVSTRETMLSSISPDEVFAAFNELIADMSKKP
jgi:ADP-heptose:LPS heptosyltransferase